MQPKLNSYQRFVKHLARKYRFFQAFSFNFMCRGNLAGITEIKPFSVISVCYISFLSTGLVLFFFALLENIFVPC